MPNKPSSAREKRESFVPSPTDLHGVWTRKLLPDLVHALLTRNGGEVVNLPPTNR